MPTNETDPHSIIIFLKEDQMVTPALQKSYLCKCFYMQIHCEKWTCSKEINLNLKTDKD